MPEIHPSEHRLLLEHCADVAAAAVDRVLLQTANRGFADAEHARVRERLASFLKADPSVSAVLHGPVLKRKAADLAGGDATKLEALWFMHEGHEEQRMPLVDNEDGDHLETGQTLESLIGIAQISGDRIMAVYAPDGTVLLDRSEAVRAEFADFPRYR